MSVNALYTNSDQSAINSMIRIGCASFWRSWGEALSKLLIEDD